MARATRLAILASVALALLFPSPADACSCIVGAPLCDTFWKTSAVFVGEVTSITNAAQADPTKKAAGLFARRRVRLRVERAYRGNATGEVEVFTGVGGGDCGFNFVRGERYVVFANAFEGRLTTGICSATRKLSDAREILAFLDQTSSAPATGRVFGEAIVQTSNGQKPFLDAKVIVRGAGREWTDALDAAGKFELKDMPAGKYQIELLAPPVWWGQQARDLDLPDARGCAHTTFYLVPNGRVHLKVTNVAINPTKPLALELIEVAALADPDERPAAGYRWASAVTTGDVQWEQLAPGRYVVALNVVRGADHDQPYRPTFYPGVTDLKDAKVIDVALGERIDLPAFRIPDAEARLTVRGSIVRPNASNVRGAQVALLSDDPYSRGRVVSTAQSDAQGRFTLGGVEGRRYRVRAFVDSVRVSSEPFELTPATAPLLLVVR